MTAILAMLKDQFGIDVARIRPTTLGALLGVKGVGARKAADLGELFLEAIRDLPPRATETPRHEG